MTDEAITIGSPRNWNPDNEILGSIRIAGDGAGNGQTREILASDKVIFDTALKLTAGEMVLVEILEPRGNGFTMTCKRLECIDGLWGLTSFRSLGPLGQKHRVLGRMVLSVPDGSREESIRVTVPALAYLVGAA